MTRAAKIKGLRAKEFAPPREIKRCAFLLHNWGTGVLH